MSKLYWQPKDGSDTDLRHAVWCDQSGLNDGSANDHGELQGATISSFVVTPPAGITVVSSNKNAVTVMGVSYAASTVVTVNLSGGTEGTTYDIVIAVTLSDGRILARTFGLPVTPL